jgi:hypothetical protein
MMDLLPQREVGRADGAHLVGASLDPGTYDGVRKFIEE